MLSVSSRDFELRVDIVSTDIVSLRVLGEMVLSSDVRLLENDGDFRLGDRGALSCASDDGGRGRSSIEKMDRSSPFHWSPQ